MVFGDILRDLAVLTLIIFGLLGIFSLQSDRRIHLRFWVRFSMLFLVCTGVALTEGSLLSPYGFLDGFC
jgi:hypothetical protein